jgi:hypothetical protein
MKRLALILCACALAACGGETSEADGSNNVAANATTNAAANATANGATNNGAADPTYTYHQDLKPVVDARCAGCHQPGEIGPFSLTNYDETKAVGDLITSVVTERSMPPFLESSECRDYQHDPSLTADEIEMFQTWVDEGMPEGDPANPGAPIEVSKPEMSRVDLELEMPVGYTPDAFPDDYRCFVVDWPYSERRFVTGFGVEPGNKEIVHHVIAFLAGPEAAQEAVALDEAEEGPGYTCFGAAGIDLQSTGWLGSWAPGGYGKDFPEGTGINIEPGSKVIIQVHYNALNGDVEPDRTKLQFKVDEQVRQQAIWMPWANPQWLNGNMPIRAGDADATHRFAFDPTGVIANGNPVTIHGGGLHMHLLGKSATAKILRSDGTEDCLIDIPKWDFSWQGGVDFAQPAVINPGDRLELECFWDNSMENQPVIDGQQITPGDRNWGDGTTDEMCLGIFYMTL